MDIPENLTFIDGFYFTDGGSIVLLADGPDGARRQITLGQHRFLDFYDPNVLPGRLYLDHLLVPVRSVLEAQVLALLREGEIIPAEPPEPEKDAASTASGPGVVVGDDLKDYYAKMAEGKGETIRHLVENVIDYVGSGEYVRNAKKIENNVKGEKYPNKPESKLIKLVKKLLGRG
jgi:hypothetical protein